MQKEYLTLKQNLCSERIFLNVFGLVLEEQEEINQFTKLKIFNSNNLESGLLYFEDGVVKIQSVTSFGNLNASYEISQFGGFEDLECGGAYVSWAHTIRFQIDGKLNFNGDMNIEVSMDTDFGNNCRVHSTIKYTDENANNVELKFMDDGKPFSYEAKNDNFKEVLEIDPWNDFYSYMYHVVQKGDYDNKNHCYPNEMVKFIKNNGDNDRKHLETVSCIVENSEIIEQDVNIYENVGEDESVESTIQKGLLMEKLDPSFSKKIVELINLFKKDNVSFFTNLIDVTFNKVNNEERRALFGVDIEKINYYNNANNLLDAYFGIKENNKFLPEEVYSKVLKK